MLQMARLEKLAKELKLDSKLFHLRDKRFKICENFQAFAGGGPFCGRSTAPPEYGSNF